MKARLSFIVALPTLSIICFGWIARGALAASICAGDCNHDDRVTIDELVTGVNVALDTAPLDRCPGIDRGGDARVTVDDLIAAVSNAVQGCSARANRAPHASESSFGADSSTPYLEKQLIGSDPDNDP